MPLLRQPPPTNRTRGMRFDELISISFKKKIAYYLMMKKRLMEERLYTINHLAQQIHDGIDIDISILEDLRFTDVGIHANSVLSVYYILRKEYDLADKYFLDAMEQEDHSSKIEVKEVPWEWKEINLSKEKRIAIYKALSPYFLEISAQEYYEQLVLQIRLNEAAEYLWTGRVQESAVAMTSLYLNMPILYSGLDDLSQIVNKSKIIIFNKSKIHQYLGMIHINKLEYNKAIQNFEESIYYDQLISNYREAIRTKVNLATIYLVTGNIA